MLELLNLFFFKHIYLFMYDTHIKINISYFGHLDIFRFKLDIKK